MVGFHVRRLHRLVFIGGVALLLASSVAVACGGDEGTDDSGDASPASDGPAVMVATFTPVPPDFTPEALQTRSAQQTAFAATQTAEPPIDATAPPSVTIELTPQATAAANQIKPPDARLVTSGGTVTASIGAYNWFDPALGNGADIQAPYVTLPEEQATWALDTEGSITFPSTPYAVQSADIAFYPFDTNIAIPTNAQGQAIDDEPVFVPQDVPSQRETIQGADLAFSPDVEPGRYIISAAVNWVTPEGLPQPLHTQYIFLVTVV